MEDNTEMVLQDMEMTHRILCDLYNEGAMMALDTGVREVFLKMHSECQHEHEVVRQFMHQHGHLEATRADDQSLKAAFTKYSQEARKMGQPVDMRERG